MVNDSGQNSPQDSLRDRFCRVATSEQDEFEVGLLVAEVIDHEFDSERARQTFAELIQPHLESQAESYAADSEVDVTKGLLQNFREAGFGSQRQTQVGLQHSNLQWVMEHRQGIPISLAVLLIEAGRRSGLVCHGVNYPGHFLVSIAGQLIDPVQMRPMDFSKLSDGNFDDHDVPELMQPTTPKMLALRMLNNVKAYHLGRRGWTEALDMIDYQLATAGQDNALCASLYYERGEFWERLGGYAAAAEAFQLCYETSPYKDLAKKAHARAAQFAGRAETLH